MRVYEKVRNYIVANRYELVSVAEKIGMTVREFNEILEGKRTLYVDDLKLICIALNVSPEMFIDITHNR